MNGDQHIHHQKALATAILRLLAAFFGPKFCPGCALAALLSVLNKLLEQAIKINDADLLSNAQQGLAMLERVARTKETIPENGQPVYLGTPPRTH